MKTSLWITPALFSFVLLMTTAACGVKQDDIPAQLKFGALPDGITVSDTPSSGPASCEARNKEMKEMGNRAQAQLEASYHHAFSGHPSQSSASLKEDLAEFESKYGKLECDGETNETFVQNINRYIQEIDQLNN